MIHFPDEILLLIGRAVDPGERTNLLRVCRRWKSVFSRVVYSELDLTGGQIVPLVRVLLANPEIGPLVHSLRLSKLDSFAVPRRKPFYDSAWVEDKIKEFNLPSNRNIGDSTKRWRTGIQQLEGTYWAPLLLLLLENLIDLHLEYPAGKDAIFIQQVVTRASTRQKPLDKKPLHENLRSVTVKQPTGATLEPQVDIFPFFHNPSIRSVSAYGRVEYGSASHMAGKLPAPTSSEVEEIHLECGANASHKIADYIKSCTKLKRFSFTNTIGREIKSPMDNFLQKEYFDPLLTHKDSLEVLEFNYRGKVKDDNLDPSYDRPNRGNNQPYDRWFGSLVDFTRLTDISMRLPNLLDLTRTARGEFKQKTRLVDTLPKSLVRLAVSYTCEFHLDAFFDGLDELVAVHETHFPGLIEITLCCQGHGAGNISMQHQHIDRMLRLKDEFGLAGIEFDTVGDNLPPAGKNPWGDLSNHQEVTGDENWLDDVPGEYTPAEYQRAMNELYAEQMADYE